MSIRTEDDLLRAHGRGRALAGDLGFSPQDATLIAAVIHELARNILDHSLKGEIRLNTLEAGGRLAIEVEARDAGPGIVDVERALMPGFSTAGRPGLGLPGVKRSMDDFEIRTKVGEGTTVIVRRWLNGPARGPVQGGDDHR